MGWDFRRINQLGNAMNYRELFANTNHGLYRDRQILSEAFGEIDMMLQSWHLSSYPGEQPMVQEVASVLKTLNTILESPAYRKPEYNVPTDGDIAACDMLEDVDGMIQVALTRIDVRDDVRVRLCAVRDAISAHRPGVRETADCHPF
jgi:hypothetical protein